VGEWQHPPDEPVLTLDAVHVWRAPLDLPPARVAELRRTLADDEAHQADRFAFEQLRAHAVVSRGLLRAILGRYLRVDPHQLVFRYNSYGKPSLAAPHTAEELCFNVAHSGGLALYALAWGRAVGVDIERMRAGLDHEQLAASVFSAQEQAALRSMPEEEQAAGFFACWVRKEAYIKAVGAGLSLPLDRFAVAFAPGKPARLLHAEGQDPARWWLQALDPGPGYAAALAVRGQGARLACWQWVEPGSGPGRRGPSAPSPPVEERSGE
jgi:4'-phosphopantetheinyl transferase